MGWRVTLGSCSLGPDDLERRQLAWAALDDHRLGGDRTPSGFVVRYRRAVQVIDELERLAAAEGGCCGFADWQVAVAGGEVLLTVAGPPPGIDELRHAFRVGPPSEAGGADDRR
jgi:hypothetical protein